MSPPALTQRQLRLLTLVGQLTIGTVQQINAVYYKPSTETTTADLLRDLAKEGYLLKDGIRLSREGHETLVYRLKNKGYRFLIREGLPTERIRPSDYSPSKHDLESVDLVIKALELRKSYPNLNITFKTEPALRRNKITVGNIGVVADTWIRFQRPPTGEYALSFERERIIKYNQRFEQKLQAYLQVSRDEAYQRLFETDVLLVVYLANGVRECNALLRRAEGYLAQIKAERQGVMFLFGAYHPSVSAEELYFSQSFYRPFQANPISILPQSWRVNG